MGLILQMCEPKPPCGHIWKALYLERALAPVLCPLILPSLGGWGSQWAGSSGGFLSGKSPGVPQTAKVEGTVPTQDTLISGTNCEFEGFPNHPQVGSFMRKTQYSLKAVTLTSPSWH